MINSKIISTGSYLPELIYNNIFMESIVETSDEWITTRTGIKERHIVSPGELTTDLAYRACKNALEKISFDKNSIDAIVMATTTPDKTFPSSATILQEKLGIGDKCFSFDVQAVCCGFIYALTVADSLIKSEKVKNVLVVGAETMSKLIDWKDRNTCVLFGDGAGAVILQATDKNNGIISSNLHSDGKFVDLLQTSGGVSSSQSVGFIEMKGHEIFKLAVSKMSQSVLEGLEICGLTTENIDVFIPHQANQRIIDGVVKKLNITNRKVVSTIAQHGNTSSASIPLALDYALNEARMIEDNNIVVLEGLGGGLTWGSIILRW